MCFNPTILNIYKRKNSKITVKLLLIIKKKNVYHKKSVLQGNLKRDLTNIRKS